MKKILYFLSLLLLSIQVFSQNISNIRAKKLFAERYICALELGLPDTLAIPFSETDLLYDYSSWLVPILINGLISYQLIRPIYYWEELTENSDTLSLIEAESLIKDLATIRPSFPNERGSNEDYQYFFRVKDLAPSKSGLIFRKTIVRHDDQNLIVALPTQTGAGVLQANCISYLVENNGSNIFGFEKLPIELPLVKERLISILTLTYQK